jgi:hypothetical protein
VDRVEEGKVKRGEEGKVKRGEEGRKKETEGKQGADHDKAQCALVFFIPR